MAYDEQLANRVRQAFGSRSDIIERKMFGGLAFLYVGRMCCGVVGADVMVRVGGGPVRRSPTGPPCETDGLHRSPNEGICLRIAARLPYGGIAADVASAW
jgi:hypothetical protein